MSITTKTGIEACHRGVSSQSGSIRLDRGRGRKSIPVSRCQSWRDGGYLGCAMYWRTCNSDDSQHFPLCWCLVEERHTWCASVERNSQRGKEYQDSFVDDLPNSRCGSKH